MQPDMPRCHTCRFWDPFGEPDSSTHGACERLEEMDRPLKDVPINEANLRMLHEFDGRPVEVDTGDPFSISVATGREFGCVLWESCVCGG